MLCISSVDKIVETVYNGVNNPGLSTVEAGEYWLTKRNGRDMMSLRL